MRIIASGLIWIFFILAILIPTQGLAKKGHNEWLYQKQWCMENNGRVEVVLSDKTRCDCLTDTHAVKFEFAKRWAEALGQALFYSIQTGKKAGIVLILEYNQDGRYWNRLNTTIRHFNLPIDVWNIGEGAN
jgi:hypothetical protein